MEHRLDSVEVKFRQGLAVSVVLASAGYPGAFEKGKKITIGSPPAGNNPSLVRLNRADTSSLGVQIFHAGTSKDTSGNLITAGGRVLVVSGFASTLQEALKLAYEGVEVIRFEGKTFRRDIAHRYASSPLDSHLLTRILRALSVTESLSRSKGLTYAQAGVSVDAGNALVDAIKPLVRSTRRPGADGGIGGFGGIFDMKAAGFKDPILVSGTDGVGTKLRVAIESGIHHTVGMFVEGHDGNN